MNTQMMMSEEFIEAIKYEDIDLLTKCPKTDLHNHIDLGGNRHFLPCVTNINATSILEPLNGVVGMEQWRDKYISQAFKGKDGYIDRLRAGLEQIKRDNIQIFIPSISSSLKNIFGSYKILIDTFEELIESVFEENKPLYYPEIVFKRGTDIFEMENNLDELQDLLYFKSIDLVGPEDFSPQIYSNLYKKARKAGLRLRAHIGEYASCKHIQDYVCTLDLDEINHGLTAINSEYVMDLLKSRGTIINICPTSNVKLGYCRDYNTHPIRKLYDYGLNVTINSDDILIFDSCVSTEYLSLYKSKLLSANELNEIRLNAFKLYTINSSNIKNVSNKNCI